MSGEKKFKESLAKKLAGKKFPKKLEQKIEQAETTSPFFKEVQNKEKANKNAKVKSKTNLVELAPNKQITAAKKSQKLKNDPKSPPALKRNSQRLKNLYEVKPHLEVETAKTDKSSKNQSNDKLQTTKEEESLQIKNDPTSLVVEKPALKRNSQRVKKLDEVKPTLQEEKPKTNKSSKSVNIIKTQSAKEEEPSSSKKIKHELSEIKWQPKNWENVLDNIRKMRSNDNAPVDLMGCHRCADENADEKTQRYHKLVALMLSSQTKDEVTYHAMLRLRENNLTPETICNMKINVLENILHPVSFYKNKAKYIQQTSKILIEKYNSDIPNNVKELVALPGVGPKMAHICMATAWNEVTGIGVDVHVHRISNRIGWLPKPTKEPEQTRVALETWLPKPLWSEVNHLLVGFGQTTCTPVKPKCGECLNFKICPSAIKTR